MDNKHYKINEATIQLDFNKLGGGIRTLRCNTRPLKHEELTKLNKIVLVDDVNNCYETEFIYKEENNVLVIIKEIINIFPNDIVIIETLFIENKPKKVTFDINYPFRLIGDKESFPQCTDNSY